MAAKVPGVAQVRQAGSEHKCGDQAMFGTGVRGSPAPADAAREQASAVHTRRDHRLMRIAPIVIVIWLVIGAIAGAQRHYYGSSSANCAHASTIAVTIIAGPLNYVGVNPKLSCPLPRPSH
jgi:hypothetical protein